MQGSKNDTSLVELQNNDSIRNKKSSIRMEDEWKKVNNRNTYKNIPVAKTKDNYENYYKNLEELEANVVTKEEELKYKHCYYEHMNETNLLCKNVCEKLDSIEECYDIEKMIT
jgi:hypothetical protein